MKFYEPRQICGEGIPSQGKGGCISSMWLMGVEVGLHGWLEVKRMTSTVFWLITLGENAVIQSSRH